VSDQDDPDVIEQAPRSLSIPRPSWLPSPLWLPSLPAGSRAVLAAAVAAFVLVAAAGTFAVLRLTGPADPALAGLITEVTTVPVGPAAPARPDPVVTGGALPVTPPSPGSAAYSSTLLTDDAPVAVSGPPLTEAGKPEVLYVANGYCPYCAEENWALVVALSQFGQFAGLTTSRSPEFEDIPPIDTWSFYGSSYTSPYLAFVSVETRSNVLVNPKADKDKAASYRVLQRLTPAQQAVFSKYDSVGSTPFIDFANRAAQTGSGIPANLVAGRTWQEIAAALRQPDSPLGAALLTEADSLTAELCRLAGGRPAAACPANSKSLSRTEPCFFCPPTFLCRPPDKRWSFPDGSSSFRVARAERAVREDTGDLRQIIVGQRQCGGADVLSDARCAAGTRDRHDVVALRQQPGQGGCQRRGHG
jgi:hypothetical protein